MRIVHLVNHCERGHGNAHVAVDLACVQARQGHNVCYVSRGGTFAKLLTASGVRHVYLPHDRKRPISAMVATRQLIKFCRDFKPDILHAHMMPGAVLGYIVSKLTGTPLINTVHNSFDRTSYLMWLGDRVVAVSTAEKQLLLRRGFRPNRLELVVNGPNGSPRERFEDSQNLPEIRQPCVVTVAGLHKRKGIDHLIRAFATAGKGLPQWSLYVAGWGPDYDALKQLAADLDVTDRVHILGYVENAKELLAKCDVFVLASLAEPGALVIGEARSAGCAIIGTSVGGIPEQLAFGKAGELVEPANVEQLAAALYCLMSDPEKLEAAKARAFANSEFFQIERVVDDYVRIYESVLAERKKRY